MLNSEVSKSILALVIFAFSAVHALEVKGDLRYRNRGTFAPGKPDLFQDRIRLRIGTEFALDPDWEVKLRLASGETGETATSTNQTLTDSGEKKPIWIDQAYFRWQPVPEFEARLGKIANLWWEANELQFIFDEDYTPEGVALRYRTKGEWQWLASGHAHWLRERNSANAPEISTDVATLGAQMGFSNEMPEVNWTLAIGVLAFPNLRGSLSLSSGGFAGNSSVAVGTNDVYAHDFTVMSLAGEWVWRGAGPRPVGVGFEIAENLRIEDENQAYIFGASYGVVQQKGDWLVSYHYRRTDPDAIVAAISDSDVGQAGDARGSAVSVRYGLTPAMTVTLSYFDYMIGLDSNVHWRRYHADLTAKF